MKSLVSIHDPLHHSFPIALPQTHPIPSHPLPPKTGTPSPIHHQPSKMVQPDMGHHFTTTAHRRPYPAITSTLPHLSQSGKTILITGGSQGIGLAIALSFAAARAANIILVARSPSTLASAKKEIESQVPETKVHTFTTEVGDADAIKKLFETVRKEIAEPDILVLNAAHASTPGPTLDNSAESLRQDLEVNVVGNMEFLTSYLAAETLTKPKVVLNVSTGASNQVIPMLGSYGASKLAFLFLCMHLQGEMLAAGKDVRVLNFHPGAILTQAARGAGMDENSIPWDSPELPGNFAVWLASEEAAFLTGKLVYATWDVEELKARRQEIVDKDLLKIALRGEAVEVDGQANGSAVMRAFGKK